MRIRRRDLNTILIYMPFVLLVSIYSVSKYLDHTNGRRYSPIPLYFKTKPKVMNDKYKFPSLTRGGIPINCDAIVRSGIDPNYKPMDETTVIEFVENKEEELTKYLSDCPKFIKKMGYITDPLTKMENEFPIAYSIVVFKHFVQVEMLLRAIYRPQNVYNIHVDLKASRKFHSQIEQLCNCFGNVFLTTRSVEVKWTAFSVLEANLIGLRELWNTSVSWKYWINLTGQEFPLRTNYEMVKILRTLDGANNVNCQRRFPKLGMRLRWSGYPPYNLTPVKGEVHVVLSRKFVDFILHNETAREVLKWSRDVRIADEIFFSTLNYNPSLRAPGSYKGLYRNADLNSVNPFISRLKIWDAEWPCYGKQVREICIFGLGDLPFLAGREELFANKFHFDFSPETLYCLEELVHNRTVKEYTGEMDFDVSYYASRPFVKNKF